MRVLVCGGRTYGDADKVNETLNAIHRDTPIELLVHGGAPGADSLAEVWATIRNVRSQRFEADWAAHGPAAGPIRNALMLSYGQPDLVVAFPGGRGTANMLKQARAAKVIVLQL